MCWGRRGERDPLWGLSGPAWKAEESLVGPIQCDAPMGSQGEDIGSLEGASNWVLEGVKEMAKGESDLLSLSLNFSTYKCENLCKNVFHTTVRWKMF